MQHAADEFGGGLGFGQHAFHGHWRFLQVLLRDWSKGCGLGQAWACVRFRIGWYALPDTIIELPGQAHGRGVQEANAKEVSRRSRLCHAAETAIPGGRRQIRGPPSAARQPPGAVGRWPARTAQHSGERSWQLCSTFRISRGGNIEAHTAFSEAAGIITRSINGGTWGKIPCPGTLRPDRRAPAGRCKEFRTSGA